MSSSSQQWPWRAAPATDELRRDYTSSSFVETDWADVNIPGHWQQSAAFERHMGPILHRAEFSSVQVTPDRSNIDHGDGDRVWLQLDGVLYQSDVWLDGNYLGDTEGYFFPHQFEITEAAEARRDHVLGVEVSCSPPSDPHRQQNLTGTLQVPEMHPFDANPGGIWAPVRVVRSGSVRILHSRVLCISADHTSATVACRVVLDAATECDVTIETRCADVEHVLVQHLAAGENRFEWNVSIPEPELWWPHSLGDPTTHLISISVLDHSDRVSDRVERRIGLRSLAMKRWITSVNGERMFLKGSTLAAPRWLSDPDPLVGHVHRAKDLGLDLLRIHAHISHPAVYETADSAGMLLWQDLPLYRGMHRSVRRQAIRQAREAVDLLGHHPSIAIWCGHNEPAGAWLTSSEPRDRSSSRRGALRYFLDQELPNANRSLLDRSIARTVSALDPSRPVVASSGSAPNLARLDGSDSHLHLGWHYGDERQLPTLAQRVPSVVRFVGQFGAQSIPESIASQMMADPHVTAAWPTPDWPTITQRWGAEADAFERQVPPRWFDNAHEWAEGTRNYQAHLIRYHVETLRRLKYQPTGGFCQFHLADSSEVIGWGLIPHDGTATPALDALRAACRPVIVVAERLPDHVHPDEHIMVDLHVISDLRNALSEAEVWARWSWDPAGDELVAPKTAAQTGGEHTRSFGGIVDADAVTFVGTASVTTPNHSTTLRLELELRYADPSTGETITVTNSASTRVVAEAHSH